MDKKELRNKKRIEKFKNRLNRKQQKLLIRGEKKDANLKLKQDKHQIKLKNKEIKQSKWIEKHKNENRELPNFTKGEEIFNAVTHIVGGAIGIFIFIFSVVLASHLNSAVAMLSCIIYGLSVILLYTISSIYHFLNKNKAKKVFRTLDHCTIFLLIAGTYTPVCLIALNNLCGYILFAVVWIFAILGIVFNAINMYSKIVSILSQICYIVTGWCAVFGFGYLYGSIGLSGLIWLTIGGLSYTAGVIFFALGSKIKYFHSIFHLFCLLGTILQFVCICCYVL